MSRIMHVVPYYEQAWAYGGIPRLATTMTRALARRGHAVTVCTTDAADAASRARMAGDPHQVDVRMFRNVSNALAYHWQLFTPLGFAAGLRRALDERRIDVAHLHACYNLPGAIAARILTREGIPYVVSPNGTARPIERRILAKRVFGATAGRGYLSRAARVIAVTEAERDQLRELGVDDERIALVPNPIDEAELERPPRPEHFRELHGLGSGPIVLFLGKLTPRKSVDVLLRAFVRTGAADATLVVAGNDMGAAGEIERVARTLDLGTRLRRIGLVRGADRFDALAAASVVVYPSRDEIFGLVPLEAILSGTAVVVSSDSGCGEVIGRVGGGHIVPHGDVAALAGAIDAILEAPQLWRARAANAAARIRAAFGSDVVARRLEQLYDTVVAESAAAARATA
ncbi:MAG TPA: glycosyltransferase family 4 protein [Vicinamibacterales bacterium]